MGPPADTVEAVAAEEEEATPATAAGVVAAKTTSAKPPVFRQKSRPRSKSLTKLKAIGAGQGGGDRGRRRSRDASQRALPLKRQQYVTSTTMERCRSRGTLEKVGRAHPRAENLMQIRRRPGDATPPTRDASPSSSAPTSAREDDEGSDLRANTAPEGSPVRQRFFMKLSSRASPAVPTAATGTGTHRASASVTDGQMFNKGSSQMFGQCPFCMVIFKGQHTRCSANFGITDL